jgi:hypothetical protein
MSVFEKQAATVLAVSAMASCGPCIAIAIVIVVVIGDVAAAPRSQD